MKATRARPAADIADVADVVDVVILGAGVSGLEAGQQLRRAGWRVVVLEARGRVGGRIDTRHEPDWAAPIDVGAEFIHGRHPVMLSALHAAGIAVRPLRRLPHRLLVGAGSGRRLVDGARIWKQALELVDDLLNEHADGPEASVAAVLAGAAWRARGDRRARALARNYLEGFNAADLSDASIRALAQQQRAMDAVKGDAIARPRGGYQALPLHLARVLSTGTRTRGGGGGDGGGDVRLGSIVERVAWRPGAVEISARTPDGAALPVVRARVAIVTVPLGVLQARPPAVGAVRFVPALPAPVRAAIAGLRMGAVTKAVIRFRRSPWPMSKLGFVHASPGAFPTFWTFAEGKRPIVVAWASGPAADRLRGRSTVALRRLAVSAFARAIGRAPAELEAVIDDVLVYPWADDPFARGAYAYVPVGSFDGSSHGSGDASSVLATPIARTLIFAGEATETSGHIGTVHGALLTGARAARQARDCLAAVRAR